MASKIEEASLHLLVAFDIGFEIRMPQIPVLFGSHRRDPVGYSFINPAIGRDARPLRFVFDSVDIEIAGRKKTFQVFASFFDVGALSLEFIAPLSEELAGLPQLAQWIQSSEDLLKKSRSIAEAIYNQAKPAVVNAEFFPLPSTFTAINVRRMRENPTVATIIEQLGPVIAKTLRASDDPIGSSEVVRTLTPHVTYSDDDIVFSSSNVAMIFDATSAEVIDVFELANVQNLELRFIDARIDRTLQELYEGNERDREFSLLSNLFERRSRKLNAIHLDSTLIVERVEQSFKFAQDSHLVRVHELCVQKMFLNSVGRGIDRKLSAIRDIFTDQRDRASSIRMEFLEWIVIILISLDTLPRLWTLFFHT